MLQSTNRFRHCYIITPILHLQKIEDCYKTPVQPTTTKLNTANGSPMMALGSTALHLWIAEVKYTHNFIICNQLPETELIFGINIQKKFSLSYAWDKDKTVIYNGMVNFLGYTHANTHTATIGTVKSTLKIPPGTQWCGSNQDQWTTYHHTYGILPYRWQYSQRKRSKH